MVLIKILLYTGIRVQELVDLKINDIDFERTQIRINQGKGHKDRIVPTRKVLAKPLCFM